MSTHLPQSDAVKVKVTPTGCDKDHGKYLKCEDQPMTLSNLARLVAVAALAMPCAASAAVVGHFDFSGPNPLVDATGHFGALTLMGGASIVDGGLKVTGSGTNSTGWATTTASAYSGPAIVDKTLTAWARIDTSSTVAGAGAILSIDKASADMFDAIVYGEISANRWIAGSNGFQRTNGGTSIGQETSFPSDLVKMTIVYDDLDDVAGGQMRVTAYRNDVMTATWLSGSGSFFGVGDAEVMFGARHTLGGPRGGLNATIFEAVIHDEALTAAQVSALSMTPSAVPLPATAVLLAGALGTLRLRRRRG